MKEPAMVLESARRQLKQLAPLAEQLNAASDLFTGELKTIEAELKSLGLGVDVTLLDPPLAEDWPVGTGDEDSPTEQTVSYLAYGRGNGGWRILVRTFREYDDARTLRKEEPLIEASREMRVAAAELIEPLLTLLSAEVTKKLDSLDEVTDKGSLPPGWENLHTALDDKNIIHVLNLRSGEALCGARPITTGFTLEGKSPCSVCRRIDFAKRRDSVQF